MKSICHFHLFHFFALCFVLRKWGKFKHLQPQWMRLHCHRNVCAKKYFFPYCIFVVRAAEDDINYYMMMRKWRDCFTGKEWTVHRPAPVLGDRWQLLRTIRWFDLTLHSHLYSVLQRAMLIVSKFPILWQKSFSLCRWWWRLCLLLSGAAGTQVIQLEA